MPACARAFGTATEAFMLQLNDRYFAVKRRAIAGAKGSRSRALGSTPLRGTHASWIIITTAFDVTTRGRRHQQPGSPDKIP
ncbi:hypothetical protein NDU88_005783 [Pleurodeles waltl]|uniref:Uncharacterized protein n=1 Tax=Pleurodeles waltl TaxID=8319 RepID=A0AAV7NNC6_PLEWA|nr:hypothetical protein NDU88_005783 [Pleurodeles waltl]